MRVTGLTAQTKNKNRVNVMVDGVYRLSLDVFQVGELGVKVGREYTEEELVTLEIESTFGKLYARALEYCFMRPHSAKEIRDYLQRKTRDQRAKDGSVRPGVSAAVAERVFERLIEKRYVDDEKFARFWVEHRHQSKGASRRKLQAELFSKGIEQATALRALAVSERSEIDELEKVITKRAARYADQQKLIQYLARQGFLYDDIKAALHRREDEA